MGKQGKDRVIQAPVPAPATAVVTSPPEIPPTPGFFSRWRASLRSESFIKTLIFVCYLIVGFIAGLMLGFMYYGWTKV